MSQRRTTSPRAVSCKTELGADQVYKIGIVLPTTIIFMPPPTTGGGGIMFSGASGRPLSASASG